MAFGARGGEAEMRPSVFFYSIAATERKRKESEESFREYVQGKPRVIGVECVYDM